MGEDVRVEYAADLNANRFGSGFPTNKNIDNKFTNHPWNLNNFQKQKNSIL